ncbi:hypothetical protein JVT61DRAFT_14765 [Boletus reticuloceps]|uniref:HNH nuclease domain-containing protein n=1 Tax=Boletus reticuloceps TaxID=495285 RepID=A0A8I2YTX4_9AGAM|nr:hypothetical protein JVT61DRAFT_14765 [Boletus reticuloceps]
MPSTRTQGFVVIICITTSDLAMAPLSIFQLPLSNGGPPPGYDWEQCSMSVPSVSDETTTFDTGIDRRDTFLGQRRCVVCGISFYPLLEHVYICEPDHGGRYQWDGLKEENWIPLEAEDFPEDDPHNGLLMCANHRILFERYYFFIRYFPEASIIPFLHHLVLDQVLIAFGNRSRSLCSSITVVTPTISNFMAKLSLLMSRITMHPILHFLSSTSCESVDTDYSDQSIQTFLMLLLMLFFGKTGFCQMVCSMKAWASSTIIKFQLTTHPLRTSL